MKTALPSVSFVRGLALLVDRPMPSGGSATWARWQWQVIGQVDGLGPFLLTYREGGETHWNSNIALGEPLRRKILAAFRAQVREAVNKPTWIQVHDLSGHGAQASLDRATPLHLAFFNQAWRDETLGDRDADWVTLTVPFAEKDAAKAAGARWNPEARRWEGHQARLEPLERWLSPAAAPGPKPR